MNFKASLKWNFYLFVIIFFVANIFFLGIWYKYYISPSINSNYNAIELSIKDEIKKANVLLDTNSINIITTFSYIADKYNIYLIVQDNNEIIYSNISSDVSNNSSLYQFFVTIKSKSYLVSIVRTDDMTYSKLTQNFIYCELLIIGIVAIVGSLVANKGILNPINEIIQDIKNYKFGKNPKRKKISGQIDYIQNEFVSLTEELEKEKEQQNRIISSISHDIKTPLTSIMGYTDLLRHKKIGKADKEYLDKIYAKAISIKEIVNDFDDYLISNKNRTYSFKELSIKDLINRLKFEYEKDLDAKKITLKISNKCKNDIIYLDVAKMQRVFSNIISNSIRYIKDKGLIKVEITETETFFIFKISDNGIGVKEENLNKIFEPLYTTDKGRKISGLGLSISKEIVEMHNGYIKAYNNEFNGLTIEFSIKKNFNNF